MVMSQVFVYSEGFVFSMIVEKILQGFSVFRNDLSCP